MSAPPSDPILLTPGPLTTTARVKRAMLRDWGSWDRDFHEVTAFVRERLLAIAGAAGGGFACVPMQGSGSFGVEAAVGTLVPRQGKILILANGAYGERMARSCAAMGKPHAVLRGPETAAPDPAALDAALAADPGISHVGVIHCETSTGLLNPLEALAAVTAMHGRRLVIDAMSSFGALPLDAAALGADAVVASANKCLQGVPGLAFVIARTESLAAAAGTAPSLALDLHDQWQYMERSGQFRFTPPTHVIAALAEALREFAEEGGVPARGARYAANCRTLVDGMRRLGFVPILRPEQQAPIIVTFHTPADPAYRFDLFYQALKRRGFIIYPGKTTDLDTFRIGCIGAVTPDDLARFVAAVESSLAELGVAGGAPGPGTAAVP